MYSAIREIESLVGASRLYIALLLDSWNDITDFEHMLAFSSKYPTCKLHSLTVRTPAKGERIIRRRMRTLADDNPPSLFIKVCGSERTHHCYWSERLLSKKGRVGKSSTGDCIRLCRRFNLQSWGIEPAHLYSFDAIHLHRTLVPFRSHAQQPGYGHIAFAPILVYSGKLWIFLYLWLSTMLFKCEKIDALGDAFFMLSYV